MWKYEEILEVEITFFLHFTVSERQSREHCALTLFCSPVWTSLDDKTRVHINFLAVISPRDLGSSNSKLH